uniref:Uncharacterized protein n=1 Tax=Craspedostauros australis TaxID=1486917 RepID=A0A7S0F575_9STRA
MWWDERVHCDNDAVAVELTPQDLRKSKDAPTIVDALCNSDIHGIALILGAIRWNKGERHGGHPHVCLCMAAVMCVNDVQWSWNVRHIQHGRTAMHVTAGRADWYIVERRVIFNMMMN